MKRKAFSLLELIIALSVFMIFVAVSAGTYLSLAAGNRQANANEKFYRDVRHVFDEVENDAHGKKLDYECMDPARAVTDLECNVNTLEGGPEVLAFSERTETGARRTLYRFHNNTVERMSQTKAFDDINWTLERPWEPLTSSATKLDVATFKIFPYRDPYSTKLEDINDNSIQWQPSITLFISKKTPETNGEYSFETTYSSRAYGAEPLYASPTNPAFRAPGVNSHVIDDRALEQIRRGLPRSLF